MKKRSYTGILLLFKIYTLFMDIIGKMDHISYFTSSTTFRAGVKIVRMTGVVVVDSSDYFQSFKRWIVAKRKHQEDKKERGRVGCGASSV